MSLFININKNRIWKLNKIETNVYLFDSESHKPQIENTDTEWLDEGYYTYIIYIYIQAQQARRVMKARGSPRHLYTNETSQVSNVNIHLKTTGGEDNGSN